MYSKINNNFNPPILKQYWDIESFINELLNKHIEIAERIKKDFNSNCKLYIGLKLFETIIPF